MKGIQMTKTKAIRNFVELVTNPKPDQDSLALAGAWLDALRAGATPAELRHAWNRADCPNNHPAHGDDECLICD